MAEFTNSDGPDTITGTDDSDRIEQDFNGPYFLKGTTDNDTILLGGGNSDSVRLSPGTDRIVDSSDDYFGQLLLPFNFSLIDISKAAFDNGDSFVRWSNVEARAMNLDLSTGDYTVEWWGARAFPTTPELVVTSSGSVANLRRIETTRYDDIIKGSDFSITFASGIQRGEEFLNSGGSDVIDGRGGVDLVGVGSVAFDKRVSNLVVDLEKGTMKNIDGAISTLRNIEGARLTFDNDDVFTGDDKDNIVYPNGGANTLDGKGGVDTLEYSIQGGNLGGITVRLQDGEIVNPSGDIDKVVNFEIVRAMPETW
jgi:hypothetical protein